MEAASLCVLTAAVLWLWWVWQRIPVYRLAARLPGERWAMPVLGHTYLFFGCPQQGILARLRAVMQAELSLLPYSKFWIGPQLVVTVNDAACVEKVIFNRSLLHKGELLHAADRIVGDGMLFGSGPDVKRRRRGIAPSLKMRMLEQYLVVFHKHSTLLQKVLVDKVVDGEDFHLEKYLHCCSFDAVNETSIHARTDCLLGKNEELLHSLIDVYGLLFDEIVKPWLFHGRNLVRRLGFKFRSDLICEMLDEHMYKALKRTKANLESEYKDNRSDSVSVNVATSNKLTEVKQNGASKIANGETDTQDGGGYKGDLDKDWKQEKIMSTMEYILRADFEISDEDLVMEMKNIFMASSDTVSQICSFLFKMFAIHPEYQERAYEEVVEVLGDGSEAPTAAQIAQLHFLESCLKETLRLFPIAPFIPRLCQQPLQLDEKTTLPAGTTLLVGAFWLHRSPRHWRRPDSFQPEHFSVEQQAARHRGAYIPFSGGAHSCIGQQYAMLFMKIMAAMVLMKFRVGPAERDYIICQFHHPNGDQLHQNGGMTSSVTRRESAHGSKANGIGNTVHCARAGCTGRYIPEDYVARMELSCDISVRLVGGIDVKLSSRRQQ